MVTSSKRMSHLREHLFVLPGVVFILIFMVFPILYNLYLSFHNVTLMNFKGTHSFIGFQNFATVFRDPLLPIAVKNTFLFATVSVIAKFTIGFVLALFFNREFPGRNAIRSLSLIAYMMPTIITSTIFIFLFSGDYGWINYILRSLGLIQEPILWLGDARTSLLSLILVNVWVSVPFNMVVLLSGLQTLPEHLYEAARIDGANRLKQFAHITLPLLRPTILILLMLNVIYTFKVFDTVYIMTGGGPVNSSTVLPYYAYKLSFITYEFSLGSTVSVIMFGILVVFAAVYLAFIRKEEQM